MITKSGTNAFHGEAWDYYRTSELYSLTNVEKTQGLTEVPPASRATRSAPSLGGPIIKDKTFFFALYQYDAQRPERAAGHAHADPDAGRLRRAAERAAARRAVGGQPPGGAAAARRSCRTSTARTRVFQQRHHTRS